MLKEEIKTAGTATSATLCTLNALVNELKIATISNVRDEDGHLAPYLARGGDDECKLCLLFFGRDRVAEDGRRETALRADAKLRQWKILARRLDAPAQVIHALEAAGFS
jgi:hypothetical protein